MNPEEHKLFLKLLHFDEKYFRDFRLEKNIRGISSMKIFDKDKKKWVNYQENSPLYDLPGLEEWTIKIRIRLKELAAGQCISKKKLLEFERDSINDKSILLHELIHAREDMLPSLYQQYFTILFYEKFKRLYGLNFVNKVIKNETHFFLARESNYHTILFALKSFEIDRKNRWPLGKTAGYENIKQYNDFEKKIQRLKKKKR